MPNPDQPFFASRIPGETPEQMATRLAGGLELEGESANVDGEKNDSIGEANQEKIAREYLQQYKEYQKLMESHQRTLKSLDTLRDEDLISGGDLTMAMEGVKGELKEMSALMDGIMANMGRLFDQLTDESKDKYLKKPE